MIRNTVRRMMTAVTILTLVLAAVLPCLSYAEGTALPLDFRAGGKPPKADGWVFEDGLPVSYQDSTIQVSFEREIITHELFCGWSTGEIADDEAWIVRIKIQDVSQLRTAVAMDTYEGKGQAEAAAIANSKNAVVAMNGDFFKFENSRGYLVRQGELIRDYKGDAYDLLMIDSEGDFHVIKSATVGLIQAYVDENLTPRGKTILDTFNFGPLLVQDGKAQDVSQSEAAYHEFFDWRFPCQRICIVQTGHLEYAIVEVEGRGDRTTGFTMAEFADYVAEKCPDAIVAYNLDGGHSVSLVAWKSAKRGKGEMICRTPGRRNIADILYFASAED